MTCSLQSHVVGTGTFGRVRLVRSIEDKTYYALKIMKKSKIVQLKQVTDPVKCFNVSNGL